MYKHLFFCGFKDRTTNKRYKNVYNSMKIHPDCRKDTRFASLLKTYQMIVLNKKNLHKNEPELYLKWQLRSSIFPHSVPKGKTDGPFRILE